MGKRWIVRGLGRAMLGTFLAAAIAASSSPAAAQGATPLPPPPPASAEAAPPVDSAAPLPFEGAPPVQPPPPPLPVYSPPPPPQQPMVPWQTGPSPYAPPPTTWMVPPPPPPPRAPVGVTEEGLPLGHRGVIGVDTASFASSDGRSAGSSVVLDASVPLSSRSFFEARVPFALAGGEIALGNLMLGFRNVARVSDGMWFTGASAIGLPLLSTRQASARVYEPAAIPRGLWDLHELFPYTFPLGGRLALERHFGSAILRGEIDPMLLIPIGRNDAFEVTLQHALEVQLGHAVGLGLRVQGVLLPTFENLDVSHFTEGDLYQLAFEPFLTIERDLGHLRLGLMLPVDSVGGPPFEEGWGLRLSTGLRFD